MSADLSAAEALEKKAEALLDDGEIEVALEVLEELITGFGDAGEPELHRSIAWALHSKAHALFGLGETERARAALVGLRQRFHGDPDRDVQRELFSARSRTEAGAIFDEGRLADGLALLEESLAGVASGADADWGAEIAHALATTGWAHEKLHQPGEALAAYGEVIRKFSATPDPEIRANVAFAMLGRADCLASTGLYVSSLEMVDRLLAEFEGRGESAHVRETLADAYLTRAEALNGLERYTEALAVMDRFDERYGDDPRPQARAVALDRRAFALEGLERFAEAVSLHEEVLALPQIEQMEESAAVASYRRGDDLERLGRVDEARVAFEEVVRRYEQSPDSRARNIASLAASALESLAN